MNKKGFAVSPATLAVTIGFLVLLLFMGGRLSASVGISTDFDVQCKGWWCSESSCTDSFSQSCRGVCMVASSGDTEGNCIGSYSRTGTIQYLDDGEVKLLTNT